MIKLKEKQLSIKAIKEMATKGIGHSHLLKVVESMKKSKKTSK
jgi:hypothetical protein